MDPEGACARRLAIGWSPVWSPGGDQIAYTNKTVTVMDPDGSNRLPVTGDFGWALAWSPDGDRLAYSTTCDGESEVWVVDVAGSGSWLLAGGAYSPAWSPAGRIEAAPSRSALMDAWTPCPTLPWSCRFE